MSAIGCQQNSCVCQHCNNRNKFLILILIVPQISNPQDVKLWDALDLSKPATVTLTGHRGGHFNRLGTHVAAVASYSRSAS